MLDKLRQRTIAQQIERIVSDDSLVELTHEAFILLDVDGIAEVDVSKDDVSFSVPLDKILIEHRFKFMLSSFAQ